MKKTVLIFMILIISFLICGCEDGSKPNPSPTPGGALDKTIVETATEYKNEAFRATISFNDDHYILNVFTNLIEDDFSFTYDSSKFLLDDKSVFFDNASFKKDGSNRTCTLKLEPNSLYEFNFIKLGKDELKIGKNITF